MKRAYLGEQDARRKRQFLGLVSTHVSRAQLLKKGWGVKKSAFKHSRRPIVVPRLPPNCKPISAETRSAIHEFYLDHCQTAGDKTCYNKNHKVDGTQKYVTVVVRAKSKKELYRELPAQHRVSYSTFAKLQPFNVRRAKRKTDMCEICQKGEEATQLLKEAAEREPKRVRLDDPAATTATATAAAAAPDTSNNSNLEAARENVRLYHVHQQVARFQREHYVNSRNQLKVGEVLIVMDFKENLKLGSGPVEVGQDFYQKTQVSCLGFAVHIGHSDRPHTTHYFDVLSYCLSHDGLFVHEALRLVLPAVQDLAGCPISDLELWMDCGPHFRCAEVLYDVLIDLPQQYSLPVIRANYFAEHHGKSIVDGHFGHVSRAVSRWCQTQRLIDIKDLCSAITAYFSANGSSDVRPIVMDTPKRSAISKIVLLDDMKKIKISEKYCFIAAEQQILCSCLSKEEQKVVCTVHSNIELDSRKSKLAPELEKRVAKQPPSPQSCIVGPETKRKLQRQLQALSASGHLVV